MTHTQCSIVKIYFKDIHFRLSYLLTRVYSMHIHALISHTTNHK